MFIIFGILVIVCNFLLVNSCLAIKTYQRKYLYWILLISISILISLRSMDFPDFQAYKDYFRYIKPMHNYGFSLVNRHYETGFEYGFVYLISFIKIFTGENFRLTWMLLTIISTIITLNAVSGIYYTINRETNDQTMLSINHYNGKDYSPHLIGIGVFSSYYFVCYQGIAIRGAFSLAFFLASIYFLLNEKYLQTILLFLLSLMMQRIALVGIIAYPVYLFMPRFRSKKKYAFVILGFLFIVILIYFSPLYGVFLQMMRRLYANLFSVVNYRGYVENVTISASFDRKRIMIVLTDIFCLYYCPDKERCMRLFNVLFAGIIVLLLTMNVNGSARIYDYLMIVYVPLLAIEYVNDHKDMFFKVGLNLIMIMNYYISFRIWGVL